MYDARTNMTHLRQFIYFFLVTLLSLHSLGVASDNICTEFIEDQAQQIVVRMYGASSRTSDIRFEAAYNSLDQSDRITLFDFGFIGASGGLKFIDMKNKLHRKQSYETRIRKTYQNASFDFVAADDQGYASVCQCRGEGNDLYPSQYSYRCAPIEKNVCTHIASNAFEDLVLNIDENQRVRGYLSAKHTAFRNELDRDHVALRNIRLPDAQNMIFPTQEDFGPILALSEFEFSFIFERVYCSCHTPEGGGRLSCTHQ